MRWQWQASVSAMDRVRTEQAQRARVIQLLEEWEAAKAYGNKNPASLTIAQLLVAGDQLASALACTVPWYLDDPAQDPQEKKEEEKDK